MPPNAMTLAPLSSATWHFSGILQNDESRGLVFSSTRVPQNLLGTVIDTGQSSVVIPLPSPSATSIPEPAAITLSLLAGGMLLSRRRQV